MTPRGKDERIHRLLSECRVGFALPGSFYCDPDIFSAEVSSIFSREWLLLGHCSQVPHVGSYFTCRYAGFEVVVIRRDRDNISAFFNVCRHRGSPICQANSGIVKVLRCPYHDWSYDLSGNLLSARGMSAGFDRASYSLKELSVQLCQGFIFACLLEVSASDFEPIQRDMNSMFAMHQLENAELVHSRSWTVRANWKLLMENFDECYHCHSLHPEYSLVMAHALPESIGSNKLIEEFEADYRSWEERLRVLGAPTGCQTLNKNTSHRYGRFPFRVGIASQTLDGRRVAPFLGEYTVSDGGISSFGIYPTSCVLASCDHAVAFRFAPANSESTLVHVDWLVQKGALAGRDFALDSLSALWTVTMEQDIAAVEANQQGVASTGYQPGPYALAEEYCALFCEWYLHRMRSFGNASPGLS
jgi:phenylpropionate dioxygenase-like ring-hydroxylating dioxygenase large terminal subunit